MTTASDEPLSAGAVGAVGPVAVTGGDLLRADLPAPPAGGPAGRRTVTSRAELDDRITDALQHSLAPNTWRAYASDWRHWSAWATARGLPVMPAEPLDVARYLVDHAGPRPVAVPPAGDGSAGADSASVSALVGPRTLTIGTLTRRLSAVSKAHLLADHADPADDVAVREVLRGLRRRHGTAKQGAPPLWTSDVERIVAATWTIPSPRGPGLGLAETRDRALLLLAFTTALRRSELAALDVADLEPDPAGLVVHVRRSKTDQDGEGAYVGVPYASREGLCAVRAVDAWLQALARELAAAGPRTGDVSGEPLEGMVTGRPVGPLFRPVTRHDTLGTTGARPLGPESRISPDAVRTALVRRATAAGLSPGHGDRFFTAHSTRSGFATQASANGATEASIMAQGRWKSLQVARSYIRRGSVFTDNAAGRLGL